MSESLTKLLEAVEAGDEETFTAAWVHTWDSAVSTQLLGVQAFAGSLNAALALKEAIVPKAQYFIAGDTERAGAVLAQEERGITLASAKASTPARALLLCVIKALIEEGKG